MIFIGYITINFKLQTACKLNWNVSMLSVVVRVNGQEAYQL